MKKILFVLGSVALFLLAGCMSGYSQPSTGWGMMGGGAYVPGMMGWGGSPVRPDSEALSIEQAEEVVHQYLNNYYGGSDLEIAEVMEFDNHFYVAVKESSTGIHAFEILVDKWTGAIAPEPGPNMMWNTKYGHMGGRGYGMMGWEARGTGSWCGPGGAGWFGFGQSDREMTVSPEDARKYAQAFLDTNLPGTTAEEDPDRFYGYYTLHVEKDGSVIGMLGVNGYTGAVWYHSWHGRFIQMKSEENHAMEKEKTK
ncbi:MAG: hypothetical protein Kow009_08940 [Spirochaetales bacterium]